MVDSFSEIKDEFFGYVSDIVYATMTTVDAKGRPRARILIAVWEVADGEPVGWLATFKTPVKTAHLAGNPHATFSYWERRQYAAFADTVTDWVGDPRPNNGCGNCTTAGVRRASATTRQGTGGDPRTPGSPCCAWTPGACRWCGART